MGYQFDCKTAGAVGCSWKAEAATEDELMAKVAQHAQQKHGVGNVSETLQNYARTAMRQS